MTRTTLPASPDLNLGPFTGKPPNGSGIQERPWRGQPFTIWYRGTVFYFRQTFEEAVDAFLEARRLGELHPRRGPKATR